MSRIVIVFLSFLFLIPQGLRAAAQLTQAYMSKQAPDMNSCSAPPATTFSTTDHAAYLVFAVSGVNVNDVIEADFYAVGRPYGAVPWEPETQAGSYCYSVELDIAGTTVATLPGTWTVNILNNGSQIGQPVTFTIGGSSTTCSYSLSSSSASVAAAGGSGSFSVTMGSGCTASVSSDSWITLSISGTTVNYTVQPNTSTSSRIGHITVGPQTSSVGVQPFTVTQAGASGGGSTATGNFTFSGFANTAGLTLVGNAATASTSDGTVLRLTPATSWQSSAAYSTTPVTLGNNATFSTQFQFRFTSPGGSDPADGITFVLGTSATGLGGAGVGIGYSGVSGNSVAIEFDTYNNGSEDGNSSNHVAIDTGGSLTNTNLSNVYGNGSCGFTSGSPAQNSNTAAGCMSNGDLWTVNINYDGSKLTVTLSDPKEGSSFTAINNYPINLASLLGQNTAYVGFTSGTGAGWENHDIVNWTFANTAQCTYSLATSSASVGAGAGSFSFTVTTGTGCTVATPTADVTWITPTVSGTTVNYTVQANSSTSSRTGHITVNGQTFTVNQAGAAGTCSYSISPTSNNMAAQGGSSSITVTVTGGGSCSWSASVSSNASSWLHLGSTTSGTASGSVTYTADANTSTVSRNGTIAFGSLTFTLTQAGGSSATAPSINQGGIVNAVSNQAGGGIAQGSMFSIYGSNLGPTVGWTAYQFPIPDHLDPGNVTVTVTQGSTTLRAYLLFVRADQINAIMPSNTPLGTVQVTVTYNGVIGAAATVNIVKTSIGINSSAYGSGPGIIKNYISDANQPYNTASTPAKPGQVEIVVGTGLGPITTPDNQSPPGGAPSTPVQVVIGGIQANVTYSGRAPGNAGQDQINFVVPANATLGCSVPLQVSAGGAWSNTVRIAISADGSHCQDTFNPYAGLSTTGGKSGTLGLIRVKFSGQLDPTSGPANATLDLGFAAFAKTNPGTDFTYSPVTNLPPPGTCAASSKLLDLGAVMGDGGASLDPTVAAALDAGAQLTVTGGAGGATGTLAQSSATSPYMGLLGGILNVSGATLPPPFLDGGPFTISGPGGKDVGAFKVTVALSPAVTWTNPPSTINRASPLTLTWTGGDATETVVILGGSTDQTSKASGGFLCVAPAGTHSFTVPANSLSGLVPTGAVASSNGPVGILGLMPMHLGNTQSFTAPGLDVGIVFDTTMVAQTVQVQ